MNACLQYIRRVRPTLVIAAAVLLAGCGGDDRAEHPNQPRPLAPINVAVPLIVDNGQAGYSETGSGWQNWSAGYGGTLRYHAAGTGGNTAVWQASGLASGFYRVQATWTADGNHASNAPYTLFDGTTTTTTEECPVCGDVNEDCEITSSDALAVLRAAVGIDQCELSVCDFSGDGNITALDALATLRAAVGLPSNPNCPSAL